MAAEELIATYGNNYDALRTATAQTIGDLWLELGGPDDLRADEFARIALEVVNDATTVTAELVDAYVDEYVGTVAGRAPAAGAGASPVDLGQYVVDQLRGTPGLDVYKRPALQTRRLLAEGKPYDEAMRQAGNRVAGMAEADVALAHRAASVDAMARHPDVNGYRRVLTGASCLLCAIASTQRYKSGELMPIHTRCDCRVAPIIGDTDYGRVINRDLYRELKKQGAMDRITAGRKRTAESAPAQRAKAEKTRAAAEARREELRTELAAERDPARRGRLEERIDRTNDAIRQAERRLDELGTVPAGRVRQPVTGALAPLDDPTGVGRTANGSFDTRGRRVTRTGPTGPLPETPLSMRDAERVIVGQQAGPEGLARLEARFAAEDERRALANQLAGQSAPPAAPAVREHGELGPVLVNERHAYTKVREPAGGGPAKVTTVDPRPPADTPPAPPAEAPPKPAKPARYTSTSPEVLRRAERRGISPDAAAEELNAKAQRRAAEQAAARAEAKVLTVDSPEVRRVAERYGVTPDEVLIGRARVRDVRRVIADEAARVQADAFGTLDHWEALKLRRPPRTGSRTATGTAARRGEYDFLEQVTDREKARLSRIWYDDAATSAPDLIAENISNVLGRDVSTDEAMDLWLEQTRRYEAAGALRRGKLPSSAAYSDGIDVDQLIRSVSDDGYSVTTVLGDELEAAAHIASVDRRLMAADAEQFLGAALDPQLGPAPFRMSFQTWEDEVRELEFAVRNGHGAELDIAGDTLVLSLDEAAARLEELVPYYLDEPGTSFEELYARIISTAQRAGQDVPEYARIPW